MTSLDQDMWRLAAARFGVADSTIRPGLALAPRSEAYAELVDIGRAYGLGFVRTVALLLKWECEHQSGEGLTETYGNRTLLSEWPIGKLCRALRGAFDSGVLDQIDDLNLMVIEMRLLGLDQVATDSCALIEFEKRWSDAAQDSRRR